ncbi:hypothetical protein BELL_0045g00130 [Botrytis elliptica]|uniref:DUF3074 domain-containing protein n=1 Tax=Botrytis elliptica TaxID=278938 RepID=A0A4Z1K4U4_9HELO|nr:hypothetical protein EAE99_001822 [Botrytis elliptica]TGO79040.1 hypothetical protein BELL_0045g00130 [Botrytis elliptica]
MASSTTPTPASQPTRASFRLGPWIRLNGLSYSQLPEAGIGIEAASGAIKPLNGGGHPTRNAKTFITAVLEEAIPFLNGMVQNEPPWKLLKSKTDVQLYKRVVSKEELDYCNGTHDKATEKANEEGETWFARRSIHENKAEANTASWDEFTLHIKQEHFEREKDWCHSVLASSRRAMYWETSDFEIVAGGKQWNNISMEVVEMIHKPPVVSERKFPEVLITASLNEPGQREFLVISIPITDSANARSQNSSFQESGFASAKKKGQVVGAYASIERCCLRPSPNSTVGEIEWIMATASDAKGWIPQLIQKPNIPGQIQKDVSMYMRWVEDQRTSIPDVLPR